MSIPKSKVWPVNCHRYSRGGEQWAGGCVWSIVGGTTTVRLMLEAHARGDRTCSTALLPAGVTVGAPVVARLSGSSVATYAIVEVRAGTWGRGGGPGTEEATAPARGEFHASIMPADVAPELWVPRSE